MFSSDSAYHWISPGRATCQAAIPAISKRGRQRDTLRYRLELAGCPIRVESTKDQLQTTSLPNSHSKAPAPAIRVPWCTQQLIAIKALSNHSAQAPRYSGTSGPCKRSTLARNRSSAQSRAPPPTPPPHHPSSSRPLTSRCPSSLFAPPMMVQAEPGLGMFPIAQIVVEMQTRNRRRPCNNAHRRSMGCLRVPCPVPLV